MPVGTASSGMHPPHHPPPTHARNRSFGGGANPGGPPQHHHLPPSHHHHHQQQHGPDPPPLHPRESVREREIREQRERDMLRDQQQQQQQQQMRDRDNPHHYHYHHRDVSRGRGGAPPDDRDRDIRQQQQQQQQPPPPPERGPERIGGGPVPPVHVVTHHGHHQQPPPPPSAATPSQSHPPLPHSSHSFPPLPAHPGPHGHGHGHHGHHISHSVPHTPHTSHAPPPGHGLHGGPPPPPGPPPPGSSHGRERGNSFRGEGPPPRDREPRDREREREVALAARERELREREIREREIRERERDPRERDPAAGRERRAPGGEGGMQIDTSPHVHHASHHHRPSHSLVDRHGNPVEAHPGHMHGAHPPPPGPPPGHQHQHQHLHPRDREPVPHHPSSSGRPHSSSVSSAHGPTGGAPPQGQPAGANGISGPGVTGGPPPLPPPPMVNGGHPGVGGVPSGPGVPPQGPPPPPAGGHEAAPATAGPSGPGGAGSANAAAAAAAVVNAVNARLNPFMGVISGEVENLVQELVLAKKQRDEFEGKVHSQVNELNIIRQALYDLETQHNKVRQRYEEELGRVREELRVASSSGAPGGSGPGGSGAGGAPGGGSANGSSANSANGAGPAGGAGGTDASARDRAIEDRDRGGIASLGQGSTAHSASAASALLGLRTGDAMDLVNDSIFYERPSTSSSQHDPRGVTLPSMSDAGREKDMQQREREMREVRERDRRDRERLDFRDRERRPEPLDTSTTTGNRERSFTLPSSSSRSAREDSPVRPGTSTAASTSRHPTGELSVQVGQKRPLSSPTSATVGTFRPPLPIQGLGPMAATPKLPPVPGTTNTGGVGGTCTLGDATSPTKYYRPTHIKDPSHHRSQSDMEEESALVHQQQREREREALLERGMIFPDDYSDPASLPSEYRREGADWYAMFNPRMKSVRQVVGRSGPLGVSTKRGLDVDLVHTLIHESVVCCVRFSVDGKFLATGCNRTVQIYDTRTGQKTCVLMDDAVSRQGDLYIRSVCFSPDATLLATGAEDRIVRVWDIAKRRIHAAFDGHQQEIYSLEFSFDGRLVVSGSGDKTVRIWDLGSHECTVLTISDVVPPEPSPSVAGEKEGEGGMEIDEGGDGQSAKERGTAETEKQTGSSNANSQDAGVTSVGISPDARFVAAGSLDHAVRVWEIKTSLVTGAHPPKYTRTGTLVERLRGHGDSVYSVAFTPDGRGLVSGSLDRTIRYWDLSHLGIVGTTKPLSASPAPPTPPKEGKKELNHPGYIGLAKCIKVFAGHKDYVLSVSVSGDGQWVVSGSKDRGVQWWDLGSVGKGVGATNGTPGGEDAEENGGGKQGSDGSVVVRREGRDDDCACLLQGHKNSVISIDLSPAGGLLATGSGDWQAKIWSYKTVA